jgi:hypothetical protein
LEEQEGFMVVGVSGQVAGEARAAGTVDTQPIRDWIQNFQYPSDGQSR